MDERFVRIITALDEEIERNLERVRTTPYHDTTSYYRTSGVINGLEAAKKIIERYARLGH